MFKNVFIIFISIIFISGCGKKEKQDISKSSVSEEPKLEQDIDIKKEITEETKLDIPNKPTNKDIQIALKNAGFYTGKIDGIVGHKTLNAIKEFQAKNNLKVDGKVGPKTWEKLKVYLKKEPQD